MPAFKNYQLISEGIDTGILINGKTIDNYRPDQVSRLIRSLPSPIKEMVESRLQDHIMGEDSQYSFDPERAPYHFQPDFTDLRSDLKKTKNLYLYVHRNSKGELKIKKGEDSIYEHRNKTVTHFVDCPACSGEYRRGLIGTDYCSVCWGKEYVKVKSKVKVIECDWKPTINLKNLI